MLLKKLPYHPQKLVFLSEVPDLVEVARRGRPYSEVAGESGIAATTLRRAEQGEELSTPVLLSISRWTKVGILLTPPEEEAGTAESTAGVVWEVTKASDV